LYLHIFVFTGANSTKANAKEDKTPKDSFSNPREKDAQNARAGSAAPDAIFGHVMLRHSIDVHIHVYIYIYVHIYGYLHLHLHIFIGHVMLRHSSSIPANPKLPPAAAKVRG
jgi:hypothetical protein